MSKRITYVCSKCGSNDVCCDAAARWDATKQGWVVTSVFDGASCDDCGETELELRELTGKEVVAERQRVRPYVSLRIEDLTAMVEQDRAGVMAELGYRNAPKAKRLLDKLRGMV